MNADKGDFFGVFCADFFVVGTEVLGDHVYLVVLLSVSSYII